jgi:membrane fusion protein (multidrug efflux system)
MIEVHMQDRSADKPSKRRLARFLWPAGVLATLMLLLLVVSSPWTAAEEKKPAPAGPPPGLPVEAVEVTIAPATRELSAVGTLQSNESVVIATEIAGKVTEIGFAEGEKARRGQVLLRLDPSVLTAERDRAKASLVLSEANIKRAEVLLKDQAIAERERDEAYAQWRLDEANLRLTEAQLAKTVIRAPFEGLLGLRKVSVGGYLRPGDAVITLDDIDPIKADFRIPEVFADQVKIGQSIELTVDAVAGRAFTGKVYAIAPQIDESGRSVLLRARVSNEKGVLRPGMFARVNLVLEERAGALMVPEEALISQGEQQMVYKVVAGKVEATKVKVGLRQKGRVEILEGLQPGDTVITAGQIKVRPGMAVTVLPLSAPKNGG